MTKYRAVYIGILLFVLFISVIHAQREDFQVLKGPYLARNRLVERLKYSLPVLFPHSDSMNMDAPFLLMVRNFISADVKDFMS